MYIGKDTTRLQKLKWGFSAGSGMRKGRFSRYQLSTVSNLTEAGEEAARKVCFGVVADWTV